LRARTEPFSPSAFLQASAFIMPSW